MTRISKTTDYIGLLEDRAGDVSEMLNRLLNTAALDRDAVHRPASGCCSLPQTPPRRRPRDLSAFREALIAYSEKKWVNGMTLHYAFYDRPGLRGLASNVQMVRDAVAVWRDLGIGLNLVETTDIAEARIRIAFRPGGGTWSYVGTDALECPGAEAPTMNFGWDLRVDPRGIDTALHQIGHALGFPYEHQNPFAGVAWSTAEVARHFAGAPQYRDIGRIRRNILNKHWPTGIPGSGWDPDSVMHNSFESGLILHPAADHDGLTPAPGLSAMDRAEALKFYPPQKAGPLAVLAPGRPEPLELAPTEQKTLMLRPDETRDHAILSTGSADLLMVLFRRDNGRESLVAASDNSGTDTTAPITVRLERGVDYILRIRMHSCHGSRSAAVLYR